PACHGGLARSKDEVKGCLGGSFLDIALPGGADYDGGMWENIKYYLALVIVTTWPPALIFWFVIHPFIAFWRKLGATLTYTILISFMLVSAAGLFLIRDALLAVHYPTNYFLLALAVVLYGTACVIYFQRKKHLTFRILTGLPELDSKKHEPKLLTQGIFARTRNPRYLEVLLGLLSLAFVTNYLALYLLFLLSLIAIYFIVLLEEKELRVRFGKEFEDYCQRVPRFIPKF
ncbi:MAG: methyltransferase family protein, partial [Terriglobia bacterium]